MQFTSALHARLEHAIASDGLAVAASACHGMLCGLLSTGAGREEEDVQDEATADLIERALELLSESSATADTPHETLHLLVHIMNWTAAELRRDDFRLALVLPDEETPVRERVAALGEWVQGFLFGYGFGSGQEGGTDEVEPLARQYGRASSQDARETLADFAELARVDSDVEPGEDAERELFELVEFVRVGTMVVYEDGAG